MGVIYKGLNFDGVNSLDYGIYITGEGVYNAPTRDVEAIEVPGRNGELILDKGRFSNISVTYKAGTFAQSQAEFAEKLSEFRNAILSRVGYKRLEDDYHPDEFRMAIYTNGLEVGPVHYSEAGEFELTFNCKPQRFLKSGEVIQTVTSGGTITNPTPFEAHPLIEARGYGSINMNGRNITLAQGQPVGDVVLWNGVMSSSNSLVEIPLKPTLFGSGDTFYLSAVMGFNANLDNVSFTNNTQVVSATSSSADFTVNNGSFVFGSSSMAFDVLANDIEFVAGTAKQVDVTFTIDTTAPIRTFYAYLTINYEPDNNRIRIFGTFEHNKFSIEGSCEGYSTYIPDTATYIDCEMGEAYYIENGAIVSANNSVSLPAILPELKAGLNDITYDDTITELKITPRYWKI